MRSPFWACRKKTVTVGGAWQNIKRYMAVQEPEADVRFNSRDVVTGMCIDWSEDRHHRVYDDGMTASADHEAVGSMKAGAFKPGLQLCDDGTFLDMDCVGYKVISTDPVTNPGHVASLLIGPISVLDCMLLHAYIFEIGLIQDIYLVNLILKVYCKFGAMLDARSVFNAMTHRNFITWNTTIRGYASSNSMESARALFDGMLQRNVVSWNNMITAYANRGKSKDAMDLFRRLFQEGELPNSVTFISVLRVCGNVCDLVTGRLIHVLIDGCRLVPRLTVGTALLNMYSKCRALKDARLVFGHMCQHDVVSWTALISAYCQLGDGEEVLILYRRMQLEGMDPDKYTVLSILSMLANKLSLYVGKAMHACMCFGSNFDVDTAGALINMYGKRGCMDQALLVFETWVHEPCATSLWQAMIAACLEQEYYWQALSLYKQMVMKGVNVDEFTFASVVSACASLIDLSTGTLVHSHLVQEGHMLDVIVSNALIALYSKCEALADAYSVFEKMQSPTVVSWTCMMQAYVQERQALELFYAMHMKEVRPNDITIATAFGACAEQMALEDGKAIHAWIAHDRTETGLMVNNSIIDMYGNCGCIEDACSVYKLLHDDNVVVCNTMMAVYGRGGHGMEALSYFLEFYRKGLEPDEVTFLSLFSACSHTGMVEEGTFWFIILADNVYVPLKLEHCICMVDIFGRAAQVAEAWNLTCRVPLQPNACLWSALQSACKMHGDRDLVNESSEYVLEFDCYVTV